jgi:hypothetical protein
MKFVKVSDFEDFLKTVDECKGEVWLESPYGDRYVMKSLLSRHAAIGKLLDDHGDELELFCQLRDDENRFLKYFHEHPSVF